MGFILTRFYASHVMGYSSEGGSLLERQPAASLAWVVAHQGSQVPQGYSRNDSFKGRSVSGQEQRKVTCVHHKATVCLYRSLCSLWALAPTPTTPQSMKFLLGSGQLGRGMIYHLSWYCFLLHIVPMFRLSHGCAKGSWLHVIWPNTLPTLFLPIYTSHLHCCLW